MHNLTLPTLTESIACFRTRKLPKTQVSLKITVVGESFKRKTIIVSVAPDTFEITWNINKRGRKDENILSEGDDSKYDQTITKHTDHSHTNAQFNSIRTSRHLDGHTNTETFFLCFARANEGDGWKPTLDHLPHYYVFTGRSHIPSVLLPHNLGASF